MFCCTKRRWQTSINVYETKKTKRNVKRDAKNFGMFLFGVTISSAFWLWSVCIWKRFSKISNDFSKRFSLTYKWERARDHREKLIHNHGDVRRKSDSECDVLIVTFSRFFTVSRLVCFCVPFGFIIWKTSVYNKDNYNSTQASTQSLNKYFISRN